MTAKIRLMVNSGSGVLAAVANQLQAAGVRVKSHNLETMSSTSSLLTLSAEAGDGCDEAYLRTKLSDIAVVQSVEDISIQKSAPVDAKPTIEVPGELVDRIVTAFPRIMPPIENYEEQITKDPRRREKLKQLGVAVGTKLAADAESGGLESQSEVVDKVVLPRLGSIAEASQDGDEIVVTISLFTRRIVSSMDLFSGDDENCYFLCGMIEGLAASVPGQEPVSVTETKCRANGDSACVFALS